MFIIFLTIDSSISRDGFVVVCICFIFTFEHYFFILIATINCREWICDPTSTVCNVFSAISSKRIATSSLYKSSTINSRVNFDIYSIFVSYSKTNKQKQTNKQKSADNRISERKSGPFIYCFFSNDRSRTDC